MTNSIIKYLLNTLKSHNLIQESDIPYYAYGLTALSESASVHIPCLIYAGYNHQAAEYLVFYITFVILRKYGGGFHFKDYLPCFITSLLSVLAVMKLARSLTCNSLDSSLICMGILGMIGVLAPVPSVIENWDSNEFSRRRSKMIRILLFYAIITSLLYAANQTRWLHLFLTTFAFMALILTAGKLRLYYYQYRQSHSTTNLE